MPMFSEREAHTSGTILPVRVAVRRPATSSSCVSVPASKNLSISASSASATISMSASRAGCGGIGDVGRHAPSVALPLPSVAIGPRLHRDQVDDAA